MRGSRREVRKLPPDWLLGLLLVLGVYLWQRTVFPLWMVDIFPNQLGAYFWKSGEYEWMYTPIANNPAWVEHRLPVAKKLGAEGDPNTFQYPPFVVALLSPFCEYPAIYWRNVLLGLNIALIFVIAYQILLLCAEHLTWRGYLWSLVLVLTFYPLARATKLGQLVPLLSVMMWGGLLWLRKSRQCLSAVTLGVVSAAKLFPFGLIAIPIFAKRFKLAAIWAGTVAAIYGLSLMLLGTEVHRYWWEVMGEFRRLVQPFFGNQAPLGWIARMVYRHGMVEVIPYTDPTMDALKIACVLVFGGATIALLWLGQKHLLGNDLALSTGLLLSGIHLAMPVMWEHYWLFVLPCLAWAIRDVWVYSDRRFWELWLAAATFFFMMKLTRFYDNTQFGQVMSGSQTVGMILVWVWFVRRMWIESRVGAARGVLTPPESADMIP